MIFLISLLILFLAWFSFRYAWWAQPVDYSRPRILMYHMISEPVPGARFNGLRVSPELFDQQLAWLKQEGWTFRSMSELLEERPAEKSVAITFDDGFADNYTNALPIMKKYAAKATLYLVNQRHGNDWSTRKKAHHDSGELAREAKLTDQQVEQMLASGLVELGAHTFSHANLPKLEEAERRREIVHIKQHLETRFKVPVTSFAYPFGIYDEKDVDLAELAGYTTAVTTQAGIDEIPFRRPLEMKRVKISGKDGLYAFKLRMKLGQRGWLK